MNAVLAFFAALGLVVGGWAFLMAGLYSGLLLAMVSGYSFRFLK